MLLERARAAAPHDLAAVVEDAPARGEVRRLVVVRFDRSNAHANLADARRACDVRPRVGGGEVRPAVREAARGERVRLAEVRVHRQLGVAFDGGDDAVHGRVHLVEHEPVPGLELLGELARGSRGGVRRGGVRIRVSGQVVVSVLADDGELLLGG